MREKRWASFPPFDPRQWADAVNATGFLNSEGWEQQIWVAKSNSFVMPERCIADSCKGNPWQLQQTLRSFDDVLPALLHGVTGLRMDCDGHRFDANGLEDVHLNMVQLHLDPVSLRGGEEEVRSLLNAGWQGSCAKNIAIDCSERELSDHLDRFSEGTNLRIWKVSCGDHHLQGENRIDVMTAFCHSMDGWLRWVKLTHANVEQELNRFVWQWWVSSDVLEEVAALRALRSLWSRWLVDNQLPLCSIWIDAIASTSTFRDEVPTDHLIDLTASTYAAVIAGADGIETPPHTGHMLHDDSHKAGLRWARNIQHLMREESGLDRTFDPMGGSRTLDTWSSNIIEKAWETYLNSKA